MPIPRILLLGKNGQVGFELQRSLAPLGEVVALDRHSQPLGGDLTDLEALANTVRSIRPSVIVNAAAYTAVDKAEAEPGLAHLVNAEAPGLLATLARLTDAWLVHYSTDYVFDGRGSRPWLEDDVTAPLNTYGRTKLQGEQAISSSGCRYLNFRTSWVYALRGTNFLKTMLRLSRERETLSVVGDQWGAPTGAELIADVTAHALQQVIMGRVDTAGTYHLAAAGEVSWHGYASHILEKTRAIQPERIKTREIRLVSTGEFPTAAGRPENSRLNCKKLQNTFGLALPHWQMGVNRATDQLLEQMGSKP